MIGYRQSAIGVGGRRSASAIGGRRRLSAVGVGANYFDQRLTSTYLSLISPRDPVTWFVNYRYVNRRSQHYITYKNQAQTCLLTKWRYYFRGYFIEHYTVNIYVSKDSNILYKV